MTIERLRKVSLGAMLAGRCPRCHKGPIFQPIGRAPLTMKPICPVCGLKFEREPGYFLGAMYISYPLSIIVIGLATLVIHWLWPDLRLDYAVMWSVLPLVVCVPAIVRWSRVLWMHWDPPYD